MEAFPDFQVEAQMSRKEMVEALKEIGGAAEVILRGLFGQPASFVMAPRYPLFDRLGLTNLLTDLRSRCVDLIRTPPLSSDEGCQRLEAQRVVRAAARQKSRALLKGKVYNEAGERLTPSYAKKGGVRFGYYVSTSAMQSRDRKASPTHRLPATPLEAAVVEALQRALGSENSSKAGRTSSRRGKGIKLALSPSREVQQSDPTDRHAIPDGQAWALVDAHLVRVVVWPDRLDIEYRADPSDQYANGTLSVPWTKPPSRVRRALLEPD